MVRLERRRSVADLQKDRYAATRMRLQQGGGRALAGGVRPTRPVVTRSCSCHDCLVRELACDPFILAIGHVALASPWFEADVGHLYGTIVNTAEARQWVSGRNCSEVVQSARCKLDLLPESLLRTDIATVLDECDATWAQRNAVIHGTWISNSAGSWGWKAGRRGDRATELAGSPEILLGLANALDALGFRLVELMKRLINQRLAVAGEPPITGGLTWPINP